MALKGRGFCVFKRTTMLQSVRWHRGALSSLPLHLVCPDSKEKEGFSGCQLCCLHLGICNSSCVFPGSVTNNEDSSFGTYLTKIEAAAGAEGESRILFPPDMWAAAPPRGNMIILIPEVTRQFNRRPICGGNRRYFSITSALIRQLFNKRCKAD